MRKSKLDDDFHDYLVEGASLVGKEKIPMLMELDNIDIPKDLIPYEKAKKTKDKNDRKKYVHFYQHDKTFSEVLTATKSEMKTLQKFDGVITPDCSLLIGRSPCLQITNTYFNRAVGFYLQKHGLSVIPNIRWSDKASYKFCFLGVPKHYIVAISTHGCIFYPEERKRFKDGLKVMLETLEPRAILVHGYMPDDIFGEYKNDYQFYRYPSQFEKTHKKEGLENGNR